MGWATAETSGDLEALPEPTAWFIRKLLASWLVFQRGLKSLWKCDLSGEDLVGGHIVLVAEELQRRAGNCRKLPIPRPAGPRPGCVWWVSVSFPVLCWPRARRCWGSRCAARSRSPACRGAPDRSTVGVTGKHCQGEGRGGNL